MKQVLLQLQRRVIYVLCSCRGKKKNGMNGGAAARTGPTASIAVGLAYAFLRCGGASPPASTRSRTTHVAHRRIKFERVYRPYLTALEAAGDCFLPLGLDVSGPIN
jgi:hypothetical protein